MTDSTQDNPQPATPRPGPLPGPRPGPRPGAHPVAAMVPAVPSSDPRRFGRVDPDGTVWLITAAGERVIASWQAGDADAAYEHFGRRYDDLATEVALLERNGARRCFRRLDDAEVAALLPPG